MPIVILSRRKVLGWIVFGVTSQIISNGSLFRSIFEGREVLGTTRIILGLYSVNIVYLSLGVL